MASRGAAILPAWIGKTEHENPAPRMAGPARASLATWWCALHINLNWMHSPGDVVDSYNGVAIHYNGAIAHEDGCNVAPDGYNFCLRWQCVEFVKRY